MKDGITKSQSKMLQGLAILMMLYHHLFSTPEILGVSYISLLNINGLNIETPMAWFFKICVGIYAFVSGYGLFRALFAERNKNNVNSFWDCILTDYKVVLKKLLRFFLDFWLVFIIFMAIGFCFFKKEFVLSEFLLNFFGIKSTYNGAWWYIFFYMKMLLALPLIDCFFMLFKDKKSKISQILLYGILILALIIIYIVNHAFFSEMLEFFMPAYSACFVMGYLISRFKVYEFAYKIIPEKLLYILGILGFLLVIVVRVKMAKDASSAGLDFIFVPVYAYGFSVIMTLLPKFSKIFEFFGKYSMFIWLTHVFFYDHYAKNLVMLSGVSIGIYLTLLVLSTFAAIVLTKTSNIFKKLKIW